MKTVMKSPGYFCWHNFSWAVNVAYFSSEQGRGLDCQILVFRLWNAYFRTFVWRCNHFGVFYSRLCWEDSGLKNAQIFFFTRLEAHFNFLLGFELWLHITCVLKEIGKDNLKAMLPKSRPWGCFSRFFCPKFNRALDRNCFLFYHETFFVVVLQKTAFNTICIAWNLAIKSSTLIPSLPSDDVPDYVHT